MKSRKVDVKIQKCEQMEIQKIVEKAVDRVLESFLMENGEIDNSCDANNDYNHLHYRVDGENVVFLDGNGEMVGGMVFSISKVDGICSEYMDSVDDFDTSILRRFSDTEPVVNIEDIWVNRKFRGKGIFRKELEMSLNLLKKKYHQFILRACSDNGFPENKLVGIYMDFGFVPYQETEDDGTIMYLF